MTVAGLSLGVAAMVAQEAAPSAAELRAVIEQNRQLQAQVHSQQAQIDDLRTRLAELVEQGKKQTDVLADLSEQTAEPAPARRRDNTRAPEIRLSGEAGLAYFAGGREGQFPNREFRADDVKVYLEAPVWRDAYFFAELDLVTREATDDGFHLGEVYLDFEDVSGRLGGPERLVNLRVGRFDIPFGEEYQRRGVMDNPLVTHALSDIWGVDEGIEVYGGSGAFSYVVAVQNGGRKALHDYDSDKAVIARVGYDPLANLHFSASAMRTGELIAAGDGTSEAWFGGGFFRLIGAGATATTFQAVLYEGDADWRWRGGSVRAAIGAAQYGDNDTAADNRRDMSYCYIEAVQHITDRLYGAVRYSHIDAGRGYPLVGLGDFGLFSFRAAPTDELSRLSLGLGYRFADPLLWKIEYSLENGRLVNGQSRDQEDMFATELGLLF